MSSLKRLEFYYYEVMDRLRRIITKRIQSYVARWMKATPMDDDQQYQRLVIVLRKRNTKRLLIKSFKFIPKGSLQFRLPHTTIPRYFIYILYIGFPRAEGAFSKLTLWS